MDTGQIKTYRGHSDDCDIQRKVSGWIQKGRNAHVGLLLFSPKELCCPLQEYWEATNKTVALSGVMMGRMERCQKMGCWALWRWDYVRCEWVSKITLIPKHWSGLGTVFSISQARQLTEYLCDWESFASEMEMVKAVRWKQSEPCVLVLSGCIIQWFVACGSSSTAGWFKMIFLFRAAYR